MGDANSYTIQGLHYAIGYESESGADSAINAEGMRQDCENINLNRKLATNFRSDVFGDGIIGFFDDCKLDNETNKNLYKFTLSSTNKTQLETVCNNKDDLPLVYDAQHDTYWIDEPFNCNNLEDGAGDAGSSSNTSSVIIGPTYWMEEPCSALENSSTNAIRPSALVVLAAAVASGIFFVGMA